MDKYFYSVQYRSSRADRDKYYSIYSLNNFEYSLYNSIHNDSDSSNNRMDEYKYGVYHTYYVYNHFTNFYHYRMDSNYTGVYNSAIFFERSNAHNRSISYNA